MYSDRSSQARQDQMTTDGNHQSSSNARHPQHPGETMDFIHTQPQQQGQQQLEGVSPLLPSASAPQNNHSANGSSSSNNNNSSSSSNNNNMNGQLQQQLLWQQAIQAGIQTFMASPFVSPAALGMAGMNPLVAMQQLSNQQVAAVAAASNSLPSNVGGGAAAGSNNATPEVAQSVPTQPMPSGTAASLTSQQIAGFPPIISNLPAAVVPNGNAESGDGSMQRKRKATDSSSKKDSLDEGPPQSMSQEELERLAPAERRRYERNLREQQRSYRISQQIKQLRDVLAESKIPFKPNKFSILVSVSEYIKQLQSRAVMLDADQQRLTETLRQTQEVMRGGSLPTDATPATTPISSEECDSGSSSGSFMNKNLSFSCNASVSTEFNHDGLYVEGLDYEKVFMHSPYPMGLTSLDGRILACNPMFSKLIGAKPWSEMLQQSLFLYIRNHQEIFEAMADLLRRSSQASETGEGTIEDSKLLFWCGSVVSAQQQRLDMSITLAPLSDGNPRYFNLSVSAIG